MSAIAESLQSRRTPTAPRFTVTESAQRLLARAATTWFGVTVLGQLFFSFYIVLVYGDAFVTGDTTRWNHVMPRGYVAGDPVGNAALMTHVLIAVLIMTAGVLQMLPAVRRRVPALHRWVGRSYMLSVILSSLAGLYLVWERGAAQRLSQHIAISLNAGIIIVCAVLAWRAARARDISAHRQWALRTVLAANGVFFFRLGVFLWLMIHQRPVGFDAKTFTGPFLTALAFAVYVFVPLTVLQGYFAAQAQRGVWGPRAMAAALFGLALISMGGIVSVTMILWWPAVRG
ncbi:MAG: DUF2306 domain-containing protein [Gemmatimonadaceae bacterium]|nr:DUF2306 domain-containing protein [Gemmatimonadaceae bacterium]